MNSLSLSFTHVVVVVYSMAYPYKSMLFFCLHPSDRVTYMLHYYCSVSSMWMPRLIFLKRIEYHPVTMNVIIGLSNLHHAIQRLGYKIDLIVRWFLNMWSGRLWFGLSAMHAIFRKPFQFVWGKICAKF